MLTCSKIPVVEGAEGIESEKTSASGLKTYIVHVKKPEASLSTLREDQKAYHRSFLPFRLASLETEEPLLYSYQNVVSGFAARLTDADIDFMRKKDGTAAGVFVKNAEVLGDAAGTAVGMAPYAHLSIYKVCFGPDCPESDIIAGLDAAVADGVDVISISLGEEENVPFFQDNIAIASFAAVQKGIFVSCATGNSGPINGTATNVAPWVLTVGASTTDRKIKATAKLGNQKEFDGESLFQPINFPSTLAPLVYAGANDKQDSKVCVNGSLEGMDVKGKVVLCERGVSNRIEKGQVVKDAGGAAMILMNQEEQGFSLDADAHVLPATQPDDYIPYLCGLGYSDEQVAIIAHRPIKCSRKSSILEGQLNYPSFVVNLGSSKTFTRTVTNVGEPYTSYTVAVAAPKGVAVTVSPNKINFTRMNEKATYSVMFSRKNEEVGEYSQGYITWVSTKYMVRSVISVNFK
ncbi:hypothetical protein L2E82_47464 [Cichorium intybus]|uniref:Uncharacterized protein n=1 Tax=Cichorium intybus TaxID=13427 RepID=A0ACB8YUT1_CICIN|nr:hypothetical protein L2E82_47464 [Cichorium intybus]